MTDATAANADLLGVLCGDHAASSSTVARMGLFPDASTPITRR
jgi:hypothetical protein